MEENDLNLPLNPNPNPADNSPRNPRKPSFLALLTLTALSVYFGLQVTSGGPVCDQPLEKWVYGYLAFLLLLCCLSACSLFTSAYSTAAVQVQRKVSIGLLVWVGAGAWLVNSSELCDEDLRVYTLVVVVPVCVLVVLVGVLMALYLCLMELVKVVLGALAPRR